MQTIRAANAVKIAKKISAKTGDIIMFRFFYDVKEPAQKIYTTDQIIDLLEQGTLDSDENLKLIDTFGAQKNQQKQNSYLLSALAWNRINAALALLDMDKNKVALNLKDIWPTCSNSPLVLAAKTHANLALASLLQLGADTNSQDFRGYTALHYACILRNDEAITLLLDAGASSHLMDAFGKIPKDYYNMEISHNDLAYRYGTVAHQLNPVWDTSNHYFATRNKSLSALRWFICHYIVNKNIGKNSFYKNVSLYELARNYLIKRRPVLDANLYVVMMNFFCDSRPKMNQDICNRLFPDEAMLNQNYNDSGSELFSLCPVDMVPRSALFFNESVNKVSLVPISGTFPENDVWIELQDMPIMPLRPG